MSIPHVPFLYVPGLFSPRTACVSTARYEAADRRKPATGFFEIIENFTMPTDVGINDRAANLQRKQLRTLRFEQKRFLRGVLSVPDAIR